MVGAAGGGMTPWRCRLPPDQRHWQIWLPDFVSAKTAAEQNAPKLEALCVEFDWARDLFKGWLARLCRTTTSCPYLWVDDALLRSSGRGTKLKIPGESAFPSSFLTSISNCIPCKA